MAIASCATPFASPLSTHPSIASRRSLLPRATKVTRRGGSSVVERRRVVVAKAATKTAYICVDCGYIYDGSTAFEKLPNSYKCPVCSAPKRRFKPYAGRPGGNDAKAMKARMAELKGGGATKQQSGGGDTNGALAIVAGGAILLAALYFGLNGVYN